MAVIIKKIKLAGSKGKEEIEAIFDSGATYSCLKPELAKRLGANYKISEPIILETAKQNENLKVEEVIYLDFYINGYRLRDEFLIVQRISENIIIGAATLQKWKMKLDFENDEVIIDPKVTKFRLLFLTTD